MWMSLNKGPELLSNKRAESYLVIIRMHRFREMAVWCSLMSCGLFFPLTQPYSFAIGPINKKIYSTLPLCSRTVVVIGSKIEKDEQKNGGGIKKITRREYPIEKEQFGRSGKFQMQPLCPCVHPIWPPACSDRVIVRQRMQAQRLHAKHTPINMEILISVPNSEVNQSHVHGSKCRNGLSWSYAPLISKILRAWDPPCLIRINTRYLDSGVSM